MHLNCQNTHFISRLFASPFLNFVVLSSHRTSRHSLLNGARSYSICFPPPCFSFTSSCLVISPSNYCIRVRLIIRILHIALVSITAHMLTVQCFYDHYHFPSIHVAVSSTKVLVSSFEFLFHCYLDHEHSQVLFYS